MPLKGLSNVNNAIDDLVMNQNNNVKGVYLAGLANIVSGTPADKGRARNNWFLSVDAPLNKTTATRSKAGSNSIRQALRMPRIVLGKKIFFSNNLPYIGALEYGGFPKPVKKGSYNSKTKSYEILSINGFSKQAPNGWVRKTIIQMANKIRSLN